MIININSQNKYLFDILNKNPTVDNGLYGRTVRNGVAIGMCQENNYQIIYQGDRNSFANYDNSSINYKGMCSPEIWLNINRDFFDHLKKDVYIKWLDKNSSELDITKCTVNLSNVLIDSGWCKNDQFLLSRYIPEIECTKTGIDLYNLNIRGSSIKESIDLTSLTCFLISLTNKDYFNIDDSLVIKYADKLCSLNLPYFVYYLFIKRTCTSDRIFSLVKDKLENHFKTTQNQDVSFTKNDTHGDRINWVKNNIEKDSDVFDFGSGEHVYFKTCHKKSKSFTSYDIEDYSKLYEIIKQRTPKVNWTYLLPNWIDNEEVLTKPFTLILSEVCEHVDIKELKKLITRIKQKLPNTQTWLITTPNVDFNVHYGLGDTLRREDHLWEYNYTDFQTLINSLFVGYTIEFYQIGDIVNNVSVTSGAKITKNEI